MVPKKTSRIPVHGPIVWGVYALAFGVVAKFLGGVAAILAR
jgi:hypothetical protein